MKVVDSQKQVHNVSGDVHVKRSVDVGEVAAAVNGHEAQRDNVQVTHSCTEHNFYPHSTLDCSAV